MNCLEHGVNGSTNDVPTLAFVKAFMTEPADDPSTPGGDDFAIYLEVVDVAQPGSANGPLKYWAELYR